MTVRPGGAEAIAAHGAAEVIAAAEAAEAIAAAEAERRGILLESTYTQFSPTVRTLDNGLTVAMESLPHVHSVSIGVWIGAGSANEIEEHAGISHFLEHLLFKGTTTRTSRELMQAIENQGGQMNAFTSREHTCVYVRCLSQHVSTAIQILADIMLHSTFNDMDKERQVILEEIATSIDVPDEHIHDLLTRRLWPEHPIGRPIAGSLESVTRTSLEDVRAYKGRYYQPGNMYVSVVGKFDEELVFNELRDEFGSLEASSEISGFSTPKFGTGIELDDRDIAQDHVAFAFPAVAITDERRYVYDLLSSTLGGGSTSRLFERIREKEGLAYAIYSYGSAFVDTGMIGVYAAVAPENLQKTIDLCFEEIEKLRDEAVPEDELVGNREQLKGNLLIALESTFNRMARMARSLMIFGRILTIEEILSALDAVTAEDVQLLANETFAVDRCAMAVLGPTQGNAPTLP